MQKIVLIIAILISSALTTLFAQSKIEKHYYNGSYSEAIEAFVQKEKNGKAGLNDYKIAAHCYGQLFDYESAIMCYDIALALDSSDMLSREEMADFQQNLGLKKNAFTNYELILKADSLNTRVKAKQAGLMMDFDRYSEAEQIYRELHLSDTTNIFFLRRFAISKYKQKKYPELINLLANKEQFFSKDLELHMIMADCFYKQNNNHDAIRLLNIILSVDSLYIPALSKLGYIHFSAYRNYEDAIGYYRTLNRVENYSDPFHLKNLGICEYFTGNHEYAATMLDSLSDEMNDDAIVPFYAGLSYKKMGDTDNTLRCLERAATVVIPMYTADVYHHLGRAYASKRMFEKAIDTYKKVQEYDPKNYQVLFDIGVTYEEWNLNRTEALVYYQEFVNACTNQRSADLKYAQNRIEKIKEELFFEGE
ncbi:MAG: tetratricopeptide repeat protein [Prolixibacteraceae bacterium]|nr:tetratricopeptide repeat protein [Prolixibacteraceae bacterium]